MHIPLVAFAVLLLAGAIPVARAGDSPELVRKIGEVAHPPIGEMSGIVKSRRYEGVYWVHNDSGDTPRVFAISREGRVILPEFARAWYHAEEPVSERTEWPGLRLLLAANRDWEDISILGEYLVIADAGNNGNARRDLGLYFVTEPNPRAVIESRILKYVPIRYPDQSQYPAEQWHFDSESLFASEGKLYLISKHRIAGQPAGWKSGAVLYRLDTFHLDRENVLTRVDANDELRLATGADLSPDGTRLAVSTYLAIWVFEKPREGDRWLSAPARRMELQFPFTKQVEAICWDDDDTLLISNENRELFEIDLADLRPVDREPGDGV